MLYYLFTYLHRYNVPGSGLFQYISFRTAMTLITSLIISLMFGKRIIFALQKKQIGESIRDLGLEGQMQKKGTPTMGGLIILASILIPVLLFAKLGNIYVLLILITTIWLGFVGFLDDYIKVFKKNKEGLRGKFKIAGQVVLGLIVGFTMYFSKEVVVRERILTSGTVVKQQILSGTERPSSAYEMTIRDTKSTKVNIPFFKNNEFDYAKIIGFLGENGRKYTWIIFVLAVIIIITFISNGANLTDGLDGLSAGTSAIIGITLGILAYLSGNFIFLDCSIEQLCSDIHEFLSIRGS